MNFANDKDQVFEALVNHKKIYSTNYRQSMSERHTYEHPDLEENYLENAFGKIESYFAPGITGRDRHLIRTVDLMLFYVEQGVDFTCSYGDIDANFYSSMVKMFDQVAMECEILPRIFYQTK